MPSIRGYRRNCTAMVMCYYISEYGRTVPFAHNLQSRKWKLSNCFSVRVTPDWFVSPCSEVGSGGGGGGGMREGLEGGGGGGGGG